MRNQILTVCNLTKFKNSVPSTDSSAAPEQVPAEGHLIDPLAAAFSDEEVAIAGGIASDRLPPIKQTLSNKGSIQTYSPAGILNWSFRKLFLCSSNS